MMLNAAWEPLVFDLPTTPVGRRWCRLVDTSLATPQDFAEPPLPLPVVNRLILASVASSVIVVDCPGAKESMTTQYDVIIIGSGAGGGTLACHLAPSGKRILLLERGDWLRREPENWIAEEVFVNNRYVSHDIWRRQERQAISAGRSLLRRRRDQDVRRGALSIAQRRLWRACNTKTASRPLGPSATTNSSRTTRKAEQLYHVHGARGEDPTEPPASAPYPSPAGLA